MLIHAVAWVPETPNPPMASARNVVIPRISLYLDVQITPIGRKRRLTSISSIHSSSPRGLLMEGRKTSEFGCGISSYAVCSSKQ